MPEDIKILDKDFETSINNNIVSDAEQTDRNKFYSVNVDQISRFYPSVYLSNF